VRRAGDLTEVLWSAATAREIVADISRDMELGRMSRAQGLDLIDRVQQRAAPEPRVWLPPAPLQEIAQGACQGAVTGS
jgi:hypothetical protein